MEIVPTAGLRDHVTCVFDEPVTVALNCWLWDESKDALAGLTVTPTAAAGVSEMTACVLPADFPALAAVTVTVCALVMDAGALYRPAAEIVPTAGLTLQVTDGVGDPGTEAVNDWLWDGDRDTWLGVTSSLLDALGLNAAMAVELLISSVIETAVIVSVDESTRGPS